MTVVQSVRHNRLDLAASILLAAVTGSVIVDTVRSIPQEPEPPSPIVQCLPREHHNDTECRWVNGELVRAGLERYTYERQLASFVETRRWVCASLLPPWLAFILWQWRRRKSRGRDTKQAKA